MFEVCLRCYEARSQSALYSLVLPLFFSHGAGSALRSSRRQHGSNRWRTGAKVLAREMCAGFISFHQIQFAMLLISWPFTVAKSRNPHGTIDLTSKWLQGFHSGTNQIRKQVPQRTQLLSRAAAAVTRVKGAWEKGFAIRDCGWGTDQLTMPETVWRRVVDTECLKKKNAMLSML